MELGHNDPFHLVQDDWAWWLRSFRGHGPSIGWPTTVAEASAQERAAAQRRVA